MKEQKTTTIQFDCCATV